MYIGVDAAGGRGAATALGDWGLSGVNVLVLVPGFEFGGKNGVPNDGAGGRFRGLVGGINGRNVDEDLLGVPGEEGREVWAGQ